MIKDEAARAKALLALASRWDKSEQEQILVDVLVAAQAIEDRNDRARALEDLAPHLAAWMERDRPAAYTAWTSALHALATRTRKDLLCDLRALSSATAILGTEVTVKGIFHAIQDVGRWWP